MNIITLWILEIFFGAFTLNGARKFYKGSGLTEFHSALWFISAIIFAVVSGLIFK